MELDIHAVNELVIAKFRANGGVVSGQITGTFQGQEAVLRFDGNRMALLHHTGAKSGKKYTSPLSCLVVDGRTFIFASMNGADEHPQWYHNILANHEVEVEIGTGRFAAEAREITGEERDAIYAEQVAAVPDFVVYQSRTSRLIPVIELVLGDPIDH